MKVMTDPELIAELVYLSRYGAAPGRERSAYKHAADRLKCLYQERNELWKEKQALKNTA